MERERERESVVSSRGAWFEAAFVGVVFEGGTWAEVGIDFWMVCDLLPLTLNKQQATCVGDLHLLHSFREKTRNHGCQQLHEDHFRWSTIIRHCEHSHYHNNYIM